MNDGFYATAITTVIAICVWAVVAQLRACEESRFRANVEVGAKSSMQAVPMNEGEIK